MIVCTSCGTENPSGSKFCNHCGAHLTAVCAACGATNVPEAVFCNQCGSRLAGGAGPHPLGGGPLPAAVPAQSTGVPTPVAERRLVSVLFADLVGFTTFSEGRDPEETRELLSRYFDLARGVVTGHGGTVEKFIGDAVMAVWGAPTALEDDAERSVRAALELLDAVRGLGPGVQARAGVLTGEAAVTLGAVGEGMVAGDLVNTASRLQSVAPPGTVLVGEATQRAASGAIAFEEAGEQTLKGKVAPVPAWRAMRVVAERGGRNRREALEAPFVGRDDELRLLKDLFHSSGRESRARLVSVVGPAGIGKSRLAWEFLKYIDGLVETVWWHDGRSPAYGEGITFWALGEMVRERCRLLESDDEARTRSKLSETLAQHVPDEAERRWIEAALLALLGFGSGIGSEQLFGAWRMFFERLAASGPVVMVFEDFHFADPGLLDFVDHLMEWSRSSPIYVVTLARPELLDKRPDWGAGKRNFVSVYLEPLPEPAMRQLLDGLVPGLPEHTIRAIVARADGIPLYAVETVRMLVADGDLRLDGDVYVPTGDLAELAVPETLTALIASRLDRLPDDERALVHDAAVLGQSFTLPSLAAVSGASAEALEPRLRSLVRREILTLEADPRSPERGQYAFVQALIREVAYNTLARADRKTRHLAAARFFESLGSDELAGALAGHYLAAQTNAPDGPEADALAAQARIALRAAAERAASLAAHDQALAFLEQALTVVWDAGDRAALLEQAGAEASSAGRHEAAERHLRAALEAAETLGDRLGVVRATTALASALIEGRQTPEALSLLRSAAEASADMAREPAAIALGGQLARAHMLVDDLRPAVEVADRVLEAAELADLRAIVADVLVTKGTALAAVGRETEGLALVRAGQETADALGLGGTLLRAYLNLAVLEANREPRQALESSRGGLTVARRLGYRSTLIGALGNAAEFAFRVGEWDWAVAELDSMLGEDLEPPDRARLLEVAGYFRACREEGGEDVIQELTRLTSGTSDLSFAIGASLVGGMVAFAAGHLDGARAAWERVAETSATNRATVLPMSARAALWAGDAAAARTDLAALDATGLHGLVVQADRQTLRAGLLAIAGKTAEALATYRDVLHAWRDLGCAWDEALCGIDMVLLLGPGDPEVAAAADRSREILARLGARPFLERLEPVAEGPDADGARGANVVQRRGSAQEITPGL